MATHSSILAGESQGQRSLAGCSLQSRIESDTTEACVHALLKLKLLNKLNTEELAVRTKLGYCSKSLKHSS